MNTNKAAIRILCYGDSNTWGRSGQAADRYPLEIRWTGILQHKLGWDFEVIEEGLRSRTTDLDDNDPQFPGRNGFTYLRPCLESQSPLDLVILWLGTNDFKTKFNRSHQEITHALGKLIQEIKKVSIKANGNMSDILLVAPPLVREEVLKPNSQFTGAGEKSKELATHFQDLANANGCAFLDLALYVQAGDFDGVHLELDAHPIVADKIYEKVKEICQ